MYQQTIELARVLIKAMIADADRAYGGAANATVRDSNFIPNCITRIDQLLGSITSFEMPTQAQIDSVESCIALPICSGFESSGILRQRAIDNSIALMWSHLYAQSASYQEGDKVQYLGSNDASKWGSHLIAGKVYEVEEVSDSGNLLVDGYYMNPKAFERAQ